ncbi:Hepatic leukemia factor [Clonorchis sinensis]|uniref:Hepatic leukemia factor n=2 Tax=Clonorchis sinensis TaxID=79923 RepID=A0A8T1MVJ9_CLOSI|nr:Hepatic leukemia factor [Clonorchis sinensis]
MESLFGIVQDTTRLGQSGCLPFVQSSTQQSYPNPHLYHIPVTYDMFEESGSPKNFETNCSPVSAGLSNTCLSLTSHTLASSLHCPPDFRAAFVEPSVTLVSTGTREKVHPDTGIDSLSNQRSRNSYSLGSESPLSLSTKDCPVDVRGTSSNSSVEETGTNRDDRYLQRRLRNNLAAKRSRDNRKRREDTIALRAAYLEKSNMFLQAQIFALKREICMLRGIPFDPNYRVTIPEILLSGSREQVCPSYDQDISSSNFSPFGTVASTSSAPTVAMTTCSSQITLYPPQ